MGDEVGCDFGCGDGTEWFRESCGPLTVISC